jgi:hypothetical protein
MSSVQTENTVRFEVSFRSKRRGHRHAVAEGGLQAGRHKRFSPQHPVLVGEGDANGLQFAGADFFHDRLRLGELLVRQQAASANDSVIQRLRFRSRHVIPEPRRRSTNTSRGG